MITRSKKRSIFSATNTKRCKIQIDDSWISASRLKNYLLNDPLLDYLKLYSSSFLSSENPLFAQGIEFEKQVLSLIKSKIGEKKIHHVAKGLEDIMDVKKADYTRELIEDRVPVIYQGVLHDYENHFYGSPDFIIRSDYLHFFSDAKVDIQGPLHYVILDVKFMMLQLKVDGKHLLNNQLVPYYKAQVLFYNDMLTKIQGIQADTAYILGRGIPENPQCFATLGHVSYVKDQKYYLLMKEAISWLHDLYENGHDWSLTPLPSRPELYPNMCNKFDEPFRQVKIDLAKQVGEITSLWQCGVKHRKKAFPITSYHEITSTSQLGLKPSHRTSIIQRMIDFNNEVIGKKCKVIPRYVSNNDHEWQYGKRNELFIDFETINNMFDDFSQLPHIQNCNLIFFIGVCYKNKFGKSLYKPFLVKELTLVEEERIMKEFIEFVEEFERPVMYHWSRAEVTFWEEACGRHLDLEGFGEDVTFFDFLEVFQEDGILVKGVLNFSLKAIAKGMQDLGLLPRMKETDCKNGLDAMNHAWENYKNKTSMTDVIKYNKHDCEMLEQIVNYLRKHHVAK